jgi:hypothetical protein
MTAWHLAAYRGSSETFQNVWQCAKEKLTKEELSKLLLVTDNQGLTAWHLTAYRGTLETLQKVWQCAKEKLTAEELNKLLLGTDNEGKTAWHAAAASDISVNLQNVWKFAKEILTTEELKKIDIIYRQTGNDRLSTGSTLGHIRDIAKDMALCQGDTNNRGA